MSNVSFILLHGFIASLTSARQLGFVNLS